MFTFNSVTSVGKWGAKRNIEHILVTFSFKLLLYICSIQIYIHTHILYINTHIYSTYICINIYINQSPQ